MKFKIMLDSGAYSAWKSKASIDIDEYAIFIKQNIEYIESYVNLDCIPGSFGVIPDAAEVERSAAVSWENLIHLQSYDLDPVPVFHMGERFFWLQKMIDHGCEYIGISPANDRTTYQKRLWLDRVFELITDSHGLPIVKTHAFGVTAASLINKYPWYSVDSASWIFTSAMGSIMVPVFKNGIPDYSRSPSVIYMSDSDKKAVESGDTKSYVSLSEKSKQFIKEYLEKYCAVTVEQCIANAYCRSRVCAVFFKNLELAKPVSEYKNKQPFLFGDI